MPIRRRILLALPIAAPLALAACSGVPGLDGVRIPKAQLEQALLGRAPKSFSAGGLLDVQARIDSLRMVPEQEQVAAQVGFEAMAPLMMQPLRGAFDLLFGLRYEPSDHTIRATQLRAEALRMPGVPERVVATLQSALPTLARLTLGNDPVLHTLSARDLQRLATLGLQPGAIRVTPQGLTVGMTRGGG